jgi:hypothetical protein
VECVVEESFPETLAVGSLSELECFWDYLLHCIYWEFMDWKAQGKSGSFRLVGGFGCPQETIYISRFTVLCFKFFARDPVYDLN